MRILVIIPAYNEEESIEGVIQELNTIKIDVDYIIVNDCSNDETENICKKNGFNYLNLPINLGIGGGVQTGYCYALEKQYDIAIQMDGDGQHDSEFLGKLINPIINQEANMVIGSRFINKEGFQSSGLRRVGISILKKIIRVCCGVRIQDTTSGFRACDKNLIKFFANCYAQDYPEPEAIISAIMNGYKIKEVPVLMRERQGGDSSINALKSIYYMIKVSLAIVIYRLGFQTKKVKNE